jgi:uncharacterized protein YdaU (DUF1376 family)
VSRQALPIWPLDVDKWLGSTTVRLMSVTAEGIYMRLCMAQWADEFLPNDVKKLSKLAKATAKEWKEFDEFLDDVFPLSSDGHRRNPKVAQDRAFVLEKIAKRRESGALGGAAKAQQTDSKKVANATDLPEQNDSKRSSKDLAIKDKDIDIDNPNGLTPKSPEGTGDTKPAFSSFSEFFTEFKRRYPSRTGSPNWPAAEKKLKPIWQRDFEAILAGCDGYRASLERTNKLGSEYVKMASTWVNQRGWEDDYGVAPATPTVGDSQKPVTPVEEVHFELRWDKESDKVVKFCVGSDERFDESTWRAA